jgi:hypothetical protein
MYVPLPRRSDRLFVSGSDRSYEKWHRNYKLKGVKGLSLHHLYWAMTFLGEQVEDQRDATPFSPRCTKDRIEEGIFFERRDLFTGLDIVFFDTTSLYFERSGGATIGQKGHSKDHRPDLNKTNNPPVLLVGPSFAMQIGESFTFAKNKYLLKMEDGDPNHQKEVFNE